MSAMSPKEQLILCCEDLLAICSSYGVAHQKLNIGQTTCNKQLEEEGASLLHQANCGYLRCKKMLEDCKKAIREEGEMQ